MGLVSMYATEFNGALEAVSCVCLVAGALPRSSDSDIFRGTRHVVGHKHVSFIVRLIIEYIFPL